MSAIIYKELNKYQCLVLHQLQIIHDSTEILAIYLLPGIHTSSNTSTQPLTIQHHYTQASLHRVSSSGQTTSHEGHLIKQLTSQLRTVLYKYNLPSSIQLANKPARKKCGKNTVRDQWGMEGECSKQEMPAVPQPQHVLHRVFSPGVDMQN